MALVKSKILVTGASGFVGYNLCKILASRYQVYASYCSHMVSISRCTTLQIDITNIAELASIVKAINPVFIIHAAAISSPDTCAQDPRLARSVNVDGTKNVVAVAQRQGCRLLYISSDMVFDGHKGNYTEDDDPQPVNLYGETKLEGESLCRRSSADTVIVRITLQYGWGNGLTASFAEWLLNNLQAGQEVRLFADQFRTPTYVADTAAGLEIAALQAEPGSLYHLAPPDRIDRYSFGKIAAAAFSLPDSLLIRSSFSALTGSAARPGDVSLNGQRFCRRFNFKPRGVHEGLAAMAREQHRLP